MDKIKTAAYCRVSTSAACPDETLNRLISEAVKAVSDRYQLELTIFIKDHFGLGE